MAFDQIIFLALSAALIGMGKSGLPFLVLVGVLLMAQFFGTEASVALVLLIYLPSDLVAVAIYRRHTCWGLVLSFLPFFAIGTMVAAALAERLQPQWYSVALGLLLLLITLYNVFHELRQRHTPNKSPPQLNGSRKWLKGSFFASLTGFSSMLGNVGGPFTFLYLLPFPIKKKRLMGTIVWIFAFGNLIKLAFHVFYRQTINSTLPWKELLLFALPALLIGALSGPLLLKKTSDKFFRITLYIIALWGGLRLLYQNLF